MFQIYLLIFWIPAVASAVTLTVCWSNSILRRPAFQLAWFVLALLCQIVAGLFSPLWAIGLVLQAVLAVYLGIQMKLKL